MKRKEQSTPDLPRTTLSVRVMPCDDPYNCLEHYLAAFIVLVVIGGNCLEFHIHPTSGSGFRVSDMSDALIKKFLGDAGAIPARLVFNSIDSPEKESTLMRIPCNMRNLEIQILVDKQITIQTRAHDIKKIARID
jgi:hypothetical protein